MSKKNQYQPIRATFPKEEVPEKMEIVVEGKKYFAYKEDLDKYNDFYNQK